MRLIVLLTLLLVVAPRADALAADPTCAYMDRLKRVWDATEPSAYEKRALRQLASQFQEGTVERPELGTLDAVLAGFAKKIDRRVTGTRNAQPTAADSVVGRRLSEDLPGPRLDCASAAARSRPAGGL